MADERKPRPVSGEIMTGRRKSAASMRGAHLGDDIVDAEYETVLAARAAAGSPVQRRTHA